MLSSGIEALSGWLSAEVADSMVADPPWPKSHAEALDEELAALCAYLRLLLVTDDLDRGEALCRALGAWGVEAELAASLSEAAEVGTALDPHGVIVDSERVVRPHSSVVAELRRSPRLSWAVVERRAFRELQTAERGGLSAVLRRVGVAAEPDRDLSAVALHGGAAVFPAPLGVIGPARCLRCLAGAEDVLRLLAVDDTSRAVIELCDDLVLHACHLQSGRAPTFGVSAVSAVLDMRAQTAFVEREARREANPLGVPLSIMLRDAS